MSISYKADSKDFEKLQYSLYGALWLPMTKGLRDKYNLQFSDFRILMAIDAFSQLFQWQRQGQGISARSITTLTGFYLPQVRKRVNKMIEMKLITDMSKTHGKSIRHNYRLTSQGKHIADIISGDINKVHERIIDYLYSKKLLKH